MLETFIQEVILAEDKILVTLALVFTCICYGWVLNDEGIGKGDVDEPNRRKGTWKSLGLLLLIFILLLALAS